MKLPVIPRIITNQIWLGGMVDIEGARFLKKQGVTHLLNLIGVHSSQAAIQALGFETQFFELSDCSSFEYSDVVQVMFALDRILSKKTNKVYVHCDAGKMRSPTIVWLYLCFSGLSETEATEALRASDPHLSPAPHLYHGLDLAKLRTEKQKSLQATAVRRA